jgi:hypothetical protein
VRPITGTGQTGALGVWVLHKSYLPHPDSDLDIPHMNLDLIDETYLMGKSKLYFVDIDHTSLTGGTHRSDRSDQTCQFWVRTRFLRFSTARISVKSPLQAVVLCGGYSGDSGAMQRC